MKFLSRFVKRRRWRDVDGSTTNKSGNSKRLLTKSSSRTDSLSHDDTTGSSSDRDDFIPSWKAENFLDKTLSESDWWVVEEEEEDSSDDESSVGESSTSESSYSSREASTALGPPPETSKERRFCNRGLETWSRGRKAWCEEGRNRWDGKNKAKPIPASFQKELVKCLADRRQFELSQQIPLRDMIEAYTIVWNAGEE